jgi:hypothetical protein
LNRFFSFFIFVSCLPFQRSHQPKSLLLVFELFDLKRELAFEVKKIVSLFNQGTCHHLCAFFVLMEWE